MIRKVVVLLVLLTGVFFANEAFPQRNSFSGVDIFNFDGLLRSNLWYKYRLYRSKDCINPKRVKIVDRTMTLCRSKRNFYLLREDSLKVIYTSRSRKRYLGYNLDTICIVRNKMVSILRTTINPLFYKDSIAQKSLIQMEKITNDSIVISEYILFESTLQSKRVNCSLSDLERKFVPSASDSLNFFIEFGILKSSKDVIKSCTILNSSAQSYFTRRNSLFNFIEINPEKIIKKPLYHYLVPTILSYW